MPVINPSLVKQRVAEEPYADRRVYFRSLVTRDKAQFTIRDQGLGFDTQSILKPDDPESFRDGSGAGWF